jgi:hypothetical protein
MRLRNRMKIYTIKLKKKINIEIILIGYLDQTVIINL